MGGLKPATLLKERLWHRCFPANFVKFLRTPFLGYFLNLNPDPGPGPWKIWTLKHLDPEKPVSWKNLDYEKRGKQLDAEKR